MLIPARCIAAVVVGAALFASVGVGPANAERYKHRDAVGDVVTMTVNGEEDEGTVVTVPGQTSTDIRSTVINYGRHSVRVTIRTASPMARDFYAAVDVRTPRRAAFVSVTRTPLADAEPVFMDATDHRDCRGVAADRNRARTALTVTIPRRCLGNPTWVRVGTALNSIDPRSTDGFVTYYDDGLRPGSTLTDKPKLSPRVARA